VALVMDEHGSREFAVWENIVTMFVMWTGLPAEFRNHLVSLTVTYSSRLSTGGSDDDLSEKSHSLITVFFSTSA